MTSMGWMAAMASVVAQPVTLDWKERVPTALVLLRTEAFAGASRRSEFIRITLAAVERATWLDAQLVEPVKVDACLREFTAAGSSFCEARTALESDRAPKFLLLVSGYGAKAESRLRVGLLDLGASEQLIHDAQRRAAKSLDPESLQEIFDEAEEALLVLLRLGTPVSIRSPAGLARALDDSLRALTSTLAGSRRNADLLVRVEPPAEIVLDERDLGLSTEKGFRIRGLERGAHRLEITREGFFPLRLEPSVPMTGEQRLEVALDKDYTSDWRTAGWAGVGLMALGAGFGIYGLVEAPNRNRPLASSYLFRVARSTEPPSLGPNEGDGPLVLGLTMAFVTTGAVLATTGLFKHEARRPPWLEVTLSILAGAVSYGAAELINESL